jgi:O-antigen/teichoic acid export membrane protein
MLVRHTLLYLPAQLLPALFQFGSLIAWSHLVSTDVIGAVTLFISVLEFLSIALLGGWNWYTVRYFGARDADKGDDATFRGTNTLVVSVSLAAQALIGVAIFYWIVDRTAQPLVGVLLVPLVASRALNIFQSERARASGDIASYSVAVMCGPVAGFGLGLLLIHVLGPTYTAIFAGFALAQLLGVAFGLYRDRSWVGFGPLDLGLLRNALAYSAPLSISSIVAWIAQNSARLAISHLFGLSAAGIYALGFGLGYRASMVAALGVTAAAYPIAVKLANAGDMSGALRQLSTNGALLLGVLAPSAAGLAIMAPDLLTLLVKRDLHQAVYPVLMWTLAAGCLICVRQHFFNQVFLLKAHTRPIAAIAVAEALLAVILAAAIVPAWGPVGGAVSLAATSALSTLATFYLARKEGLTAPWGDGARILVATVAMALVLWPWPLSQSFGWFVLRAASGGGSFALALAIMYPHLIRKALAQARRRRT